MARGWESKAIEQQQEEATTKSSKGPRLTPEQVAEKQRRSALELSRARIAQQLATASNPKHRQMLEAALKDLDAQLGTEAGNTLASG